MNILLLSPDLETNVTYHSDELLLSNIIKTLKLISDCIFILSDNIKEHEWLSSWKEDDDNKLFKYKDHPLSLDLTLNWIVFEDKELLKDKLSIACCYYLSLSNEAIFRFESKPPYYKYYNIIFSLLRNIHPSMFMDISSVDEIYEYTFYSLLKTNSLCKLTAEFNSGNINRDYQSLIRKNKAQFNTFTKRPNPNFYEKDMYDTFL